MIIFDLDGTLANCEHRRHFVDPSQNAMYLHRCNPRGKENFQELSGWFHIYTNRKFKPDWKAFFEACDQDTPIKTTLEILINCLLSGRKVQIWTGRCESVREKTMRWLKENLYSCYRLRSLLLDDLELKVKMRPIGDYTPDYQLKERWLDDALTEGKTIEFVFDDRAKVIQMYRRRGIFVFDCNQEDHEF